MIKKNRFCIDCDTCIKNRGTSTKRCKKCAEKIRTEYVINYNEAVRQERRKNLPPIPPKKCIDCKICIEHMNHMALRCKECAKIEKLARQKRYLKNRPPLQKKRKTLSRLRNVYY